MRMELLSAKRRLPLVIRPADPEVDVFVWAMEHRELLHEKLLDHGGLLFRGFTDFSPSHLEEFMRTVTSEPLPYNERSSPRHQVNGNIYTSTDHPASQEIFVHNENSYQNSWPLYIFFLSIDQAQSGGETPIADCRAVYDEIDPAIRASFQEKGLCIVRNYNTGMGLTWQTVFNSEDPATVNAYCAKNQIQTEWLPNGVLRTTTMRTSPVAVHPKTGAKIWFNHGTFFHVTTLGKELSDTLLACLPKESLPTNTYYGDGSDIEPEVLNHLRSVYHKHTVKFPWQAGDLLMLDNMLTAHGRASFKGTRKVVVGMSEPMSRTG